MPNESLPANLREIAEVLLHGGYCNPPHERVAEIRAAAERIEHLEGTLPVMKWMRQAEAAAERIEELEKRIANTTQAAQLLQDLQIGMKAELDRTREALRKDWIVEISPGFFMCRCTRASDTTLPRPRWKIGQQEIHNPVTINGVEGPCPARPREET